MGNLSLILIFVVVCLLGTVSTLNATKIIEFYSPAAAGVESRQFFNGNNLQLHFPNLIAVCVMLFTRCYEFFFGSTETTTATTTTTTTTTTTQKLTCELLGGMTCDAIDTSPNCITLANAASTEPTTWASTCAQTGSGMGVVYSDGDTTGTAIPTNDVLKCLFGLAVLEDADLISINLDGTDCKKITTGTPGDTAAATVVTEACVAAPFVCAVAVPP